MVVPLPNHPSTTLPTCPGVAQRHENRGTISISATRRTDLRQLTAEVQTSPVRFEHLRAPPVPPARIYATRRLVRDSSARSSGRSAIACSTLQTLVRPTARSVPLGKCQSRLSVQLELSHLFAATTSVSGPLGLSMSWSERSNAHVKPVGPGARPPGMCNVLHGWHSDSDTVGSNSVSARLLVCLTCPRGGTATPTPQAQTQSA